MRSVAIVFCAILVLFSFSQVQATIIQVPGDQPSIQAGINASSNGDTVLVAPNIYYENVTFNGINVVLASWFLTTADTSYISATIIDGSSTGSVITLSNEEDNRTKVVGFTITHGSANGGGGIYCGGNCSPVVESNSFLFNEAGTDGGGICCWYSLSPTIRGNTFRGNTATWGGAIYCNRASPTIAGNSIFENSAGSGGGITFLNSSSGMVSSNTIDRNDATYGGGIFIRNSSSVFRNTIITNSVDGGGITAETSSPYITYCDVWNNVGGDYTGCTPGEGCISADPVFCDPENDNYYLHSTSLCRGTGEGGANMGAFGVGCGPPVIVSAGPDQSGPASSQVFPIFYIQNTTDSSFTFDLNVFDTLGWSIVPAYVEMTLDPDQVDSIILTVSVPDVMTGTVDRITLIATSQSDSLTLHWGFLTVSVSPRTIPVPDEQPSIQAGINASGPGDTVLVAPGTYYEHPNFNGKAIVLKSEDGAESTIISMLAGGVSMVSFVSGEDSTSVLDGFTITGAFLEVGQGGGIKCQNSSPKIVNNRIVDNSCPYGAGIDCDNYSSPIIANNLIEQNPATSSGGGIRCNNHSSPVIRENLIIDNSAVESGAGIWCEDNCSPTIVGNLIAQNTAGIGYGGGIGLLNSSVADIIDNTIDANSASTGGGIYIGATSSATIQNTIVTNTTSGKGVRHDGASPIFLYYCDVWNNLDQDYYGCLPGDGCISDDPVYCDPDSGDYSLWAGSPCLGAGQEGTDIGAFGVGCSAVGDANGDGEVNIGDVVYLVSYLYRAGPAPQPVPSGDVNCDGLINVGDIVYLVNYLFKGGPPPCEP